jgi:hypothetical protein
MKAIYRMCPVLLPPSAYRYTFSQARHLQSLRIGSCKQAMGLYRRLEDSVVAMTMATPRPAGGGSAISLLRTPTSLPGLQLRGICAAPGLFYRSRRVLLPVVSAYRSLRVDN